MFLKHVHIFLHFLVKVYQSFIFVSGDCSVIVSTYDIEEESGPPRFNLPTTKALLFPTSFLNYVFSNECLQKVEEKIKELLNSPEYLQFGLNERFYFVEHHKIPATALPIDIGIAPFSDYETEINNKIALEKHFYLVLRYAFNEVEIPPSISRKRAETLKSLYENKKILTRLPLSEVISYVNK